MTKRVKLTEKKKWAIFFEILQKKPVIISLIYIIFSASMLCKNHDFCVMLINVLKEALK